MKEILCPHDSGAVTNPRQVVADHHPLTKKEIAALLEEARDSENPLTSKIQIRLCQGIPGLVCPRAIEGPVSDKENEINALYVENFQKGADPKIVDELYAIMMR